MLYVSFDICPPQGVETGSVTGSNEKGIYMLLVELLTSLAQMGRSRRGGGGGGEGAGLGGQVASPTIQLGSSP